MPSLDRASCDACRQHHIECESHVRVRPIGRHPHRCTDCPCVLRRANGTANSNRGSSQALKNDPLHVFSESVQALSAKVTKSVVQVLTSGFGLSSDNQKTDTAYLEAQHGIGAGVFFRPTATS